MADDILGLAAQLSYYFFLALFPAILFVLAIASFFPLSNITDDLGRALGPFVSPQVLELIQDQMRRLANNESGGLLTFGVAAALWSSSAALVSIVGALNRAYDIDEGRPWWKVRLVAIGLTVGTAVFVLGALSLVLAGPTLADFLGDSTGWGTPFKWTWLILQWPIVFALFLPRLDAFITSVLTPIRTGAGLLLAQWRQLSCGSSCRCSSSCISPTSPTTTVPTGRSVASSSCYSGFTCRVWRSSLAPSSTRRSNMPRRTAKHRARRTPTARPSWDAARRARLRSGNLCLIPPTRL